MRVEAGSSVSSSSMSVCERQRIIPQHIHVPNKLEPGYILSHDGSSLIHRSLFTIPHLLHKVNDLFDLIHKAVTMQHIGNKMKGNKRDFMQSNVPPEMRE
jgi:hypothetical protein